MATDRIYGDLQYAGVKVTTAAKSQINSDGTDGYAVLVAPLGADGATPASSANPVPVVAAPPTSTTTSGHTSTVTQTHGNDTTSYGAMDVIGVDTNTSAVVEFTNMGIAGTDVLISALKFEMDISAVPSGMTTIQLALYSATPPSAYKDNAAWDLPSGDRSVFLGLYSFGAPADLGSTLFVQTMGPIDQITLTTTSLFGYFITTTAYTPAASTVRKGALCTLQL